MIGEFAVRQGVKVVQERQRPRGNTNAKSHDPATSDLDSETSSLEDTVSGARSVLADDLEPMVDYDTYTARQIIGRIPLLSADERRRVFHYESAHRARETILSALAQSDSSLAVAE